MATPYWYYKGKVKDADPCGDKFCNYWIKSKRNACKAVRSCACNICQEWFGETYSQPTPQGYILSGLYEDCLHQCSDNPNLTRESFIEMAIANGALTSDLQPVPPGLINDNNYLEQKEQIESGNYDEMIVFSILIIVLLLAYLWLD